MGTAQSQDMVDMLVEDHREVEQLFKDLESKAGSPKERTQKASVVIAELVRHSIAEEQYLYPTARKALKDGDKIADHEIEEHAEAEQVMKQLEGLEATDPDFDRLVTSLIADVRHHISEEEGDLFPQLRQACSHDDLVELGRKVETAKKTAPTRPHPSAPDSPPANKLLAPGTGLVDKVRDAFSQRPTSTDDL